MLSRLARVVWACREWFGKGNEMSVASRALRTRMSDARTAVGALRVWVLMGGLAAVATVSLGGGGRARGVQCESGLHADDVGSQVVIRGGWGSKLTTLFVFAGVGERQGQIYVWQNRNRASAPSEMDRWYASSGAFVESMNAEDRILYELWAGDETDAAGIGRSSSVPIRALRRAELDVIVAGIQMNATHP
jgi:hypothetical protein